MSTLAIEPSLADGLPTVVKASLAGMSDLAQQQFAEEYGRKRRSVGFAYLTSLLYLHYAYVGRVGMTLLMWLAAICSFGVLGLIWWVIDLFRMPGIVRNRNADIATAILRDQKIIAGA